MAAVCDICGKGPGFGKSVSHSHRRTSRRWALNPLIKGQPQIHRLAKGMTAWGRPAARTLKRGRPRQPQTPQLHPLMRDQSRSPPRLALETLTWPSPRC